MSSLLASDQTWLVLAAVMTCGAVSLALEQKTVWGARIGGPVLALLLPMILSNLRVLPLEAPVYDVVDDYLVPMAIPLLLMRADAGRILRESGSLFATFHVAALGSVLGALLAAWLFHGTVERTPEVAGIMAASYIGGAVNFVAVRNSYGVPAEVGNPLIVADNFIMAAMFAGLVVLAGSRWMRARYRHPYSLEGDRTDPRELIERHWRPKAISLLDLAQALAFAAGLAAVGMSLTGWVKSRLPWPILISFLANPFVLITLLTVTVSSVGKSWVSRIQGGDEVGMVLLYLFFVVLGVRADFVQVVRNVPVLFLFCAVIAVSNLAVALLVGRGLKMSLEELLLSVNATLGGAPSAAAMAISRGWGGLVLPGLLVGIWGYVIGTPLGIVVVELTRRWF